MPARSRVLRLIRSRQAEACRVVVPAQERFPHPESAPGRAMGPRSSSSGPSDVAAEAVSSVGHSRCMGGRSRFCIAKLPVTTEPSAHRNEQRMCRGEHPPERDSSRNQARRDRGRGVLDGAPPCPCQGKDAGGCQTLARTNADLRPAGVGFFPAHEWVGILAPEEAGRADRRTRCSPERGTGSDEVTENQPHA